MPAFESVFDQEACGEEMVRLPKIELTLKLTAAEEGSPFWSQLLHNQLFEQLREILRARRGPPKELPVWKPSSARQNQFQTLLYYLRSGSVPWEAAGIAAQKLAAELQKNCREPGQIVTLLQTEPSPAPAFCFRLLQLLPASEVANAVRTIFAEASSPGQMSIFELIGPLLATGQKYFGRHTQLQLAALFLSEALAAGPTKSVSEVIRSAQRALPLASIGLDEFIASLPAQKDPRATADFISSATEGNARTQMRNRGFSRPGVSSEAESSAEIGRAISDRVGGARHRERSEENAAEKETGLRRWKGESGRSGVSQTQAPAGAFQSEPSSLSESPTDFPVLVTHAGLILLNPFLPRFFESSGYTEKIDIELSPFFLPRAAALLHFLATGDDAIYEYDLAFIKVLLGVRPETPLGVSEGLIGDADKREAEALLQSVIEHWAVLKQTSITALCGSFLQRWGLLRENEGGWKLQIERQPFDVLLEGLPWGISVVKLPWMKCPIYTEW